MILVFKILSKSIHEGVATLQLSLAKLNMSLPIPKRKVQVAVIGAGAVGVSVGLNLLEKLSSNLVVSIISDEFSPRTVSDKAGAVIIPFDVRAKGKSEGKSNDDDTGHQLRVRKWTRETYRHLEDLYSSRFAEEVNIQLVHGYFGNQEDTVDPWWGRELVTGFRRVGDEEKAYKRIPLSIRNVFAFNTFILSGSDYLNWLMKRFQEKGGFLVKMKINNFHELSSYDIIINCTGLGASSLVQDPLLYPVRGDTVTILAPWIKEFFLLTNDEEDYVMYVFPRSADVLLGGSKVTNEWSKEINEETSSKIIKNCSSIIPSISNAAIVDYSVGLRPARKEIRFEVDAENPSLIHCYGHGGQGIVTHWGCALEVTEIIRNYIDLMHRRVPSKL
ncbi:PREDICTED: D-aspartate oxidase-like [Amphimedon queenslandica]|uniref:FAD dependent oxidoreductase domain-containing protein n=1 Tax=Amphimedon queenslandica TaxID=400682 RepID=A0A1X7VL09_AMPQE|nr:PREDICTED: D-aspartate oxidase-like [Amphimedon queenslandica]|eukprot:XP_003383966.2 PREDICTED: D-aspartate oxidase-like [Amphimedon queenslandica]